jgi:hypothetical protein
MLQNAKAYAMIPWIEGHLPKKATFTGASLLQYMHYIFIYVYKVVEKQLNRQKTSL